MGKKPKRIAVPLQGMEYVGEYWIPGVPARDLDAQEAEQYREQIAATERATGRTLYRPIYEKTSQDEQED